MANRVPITIRLESFEGPLDLLLYLIQTHELDVSRVSITQITDQYLAYVKLMQELNFDIASEFLVMAATLLHWKSRALLPQVDGPAGATEGVLEESLSQEALVLQLMELKRFREAGQNLGQLPLLGLDVFARFNSKPPIERVWREMNFSDLAVTFQQILVRARKRTHVLKKETVSISDKIKEFADRLVLNHLIEFRSLMAMPATRTEIVVTFLTALELARLKRMRVYQEQTYGSIYLELIEDLKDFNFQLATGFDTVTQTAPAAATVS